MEYIVAKNIANYVRRKQKKKVLPNTCPFCSRESVEKPCRQCMEDALETILDKTLNEKQETR